MKNDILKLIQSKISKIITGIFLFCYFGFIISPELSRSISTLFILWLLLLPVVLITLVVIGFRAGIGLWREEAQKTPLNLQNKYFGWLAGLGLLWFAISIFLSNVAYDKYAHQKFDSEIWKNSKWNDGRLIQLSPRQRMFDDLINNVLPGITKTEMLDLLGKPDEQREIKNKEAFIYYYGYGYFDIACLIIYFDDEDFIKEYFILECG